jgi:putative membrane protein
MMEWKNIYRGLIMGASDVIPGVSGGTIAVLLGIYDRLIAAINGIFSKEWKRHLGFLIPLGIGIGMAVLLLSRLIEWLFEYYPDPTKYFFLGLIIGILPYLFRQAEVKVNFKVNHYLLLLVGAVLVGSMLFLQEREGIVIEEMTFSIYLLLFFSAFIASAAMILPGISGSFILLVIGVYPVVISAISNLQLDIITVVGVGIVFGILTMSKIINYFLVHYRHATFAIIIGLVIGSIFVVFPGWPSSTSVLLLSVVAFAVGLFVAYVLGKVEYTDESKA